MTEKAYRAAVARQEGPPGESTVSSVPGVAGGAEWSRRAQRPALGLVVMFGLGGIFVEVFKDVVPHRADRRRRGRVRDPRDQGLLLSPARAARPADVDTRKMSRLSLLRRQRRPVRVDRRQRSPARAGAVAVDAVIVPKK
jgi:hypothetical protein